MTERAIDGSPITKRPAIDADLSPAHWLLAFVAASPVVLGAQVRSLCRLRDDADAGLIDELIAQGWVTYGPRLEPDDDAYQVTAAGLRELSSDLPPPTIDLRRQSNDVAAAWASVSVRRGVFGSGIDRVFTQREMRAADAHAPAMGSGVESRVSPDVTAKVRDASFALRVSAGEGAPEVHYPDLVAVLPRGRVAIEFHFTRPDPTRLAALLDAYAAKRSVALVVFFFEDRVIGSVLRAAVDACPELEGRARVEYARWARRAPRTA